MRISYGISIDSKIKRKANLIAKKEGRSFSNYVERLLEKDIDRQKLINSLKENQK